MEETGKVIGISDDMARVEVLRKKLCRKCPAETFCRSGEGMLRSIEAKNKISARIGDTVKIKISSSRIFKSALLVYILPIVIFLSVIAAAQVLLNSQGLSIVLGFCAIALFFMLIEFVDKKIGRSKCLIPTIKEIVSEGRSD